MSFLEKTRENMADEHNGLMAAGASLVWRRRNILWWVFSVNIVLGALGTLPALRQLHHALGHNLAGEQLYKGFDVGTFYELLRVPDVSLLRFRVSSYACASLFALFLLFVSGGILETYRQDGSLNIGDFLAASGAYFWRFVQLTLFSLVPFGLAGAAYFDVDKASDYLGDKAVADQVGFVIWLVGVIFLGLIVLFVRLWFDIAKVRTVAQDERRMFRSAWKGLAATRRQRRSLAVDVSPHQSCRVDKYAGRVPDLDEAAAYGNLGDFCSARTGGAGAVGSTAVANGKCDHLV